MSKENKIKKQIPLITIIVVVLLIIAVTISIVVATSIKAYYNNMHYQGEVLATNYSMQYSNVINEYFDSRIEYLEKVDKKIQESGVSVADGLKQEDYSIENFWRIFYIKDGVMKDSTASENTRDINEQIKEYYDAKESGVTGRFYKDTNDYGSIAFCYYANKPEYDMLVGYVLLNNFKENLIDAFSKLIDVPDFYIMPICNSDGKYIGQFTKENDFIDFDISHEKTLGGYKVEDVFASINRFSSGKFDNEKVLEAVKSDGNFPLYFNELHNEYILSVFSPLKSNDNLLFCQIYESKTILSEQNNFIAIILISITILAFIVLVLAILGFKYRKAWLKKLEYQENYEPLTGANTYKMFKDSFTFITSYNKYSKYAIIYFELTQFDILYENYGENTTNEVISFCSKIVGKSIDKSETYGHISNGKFILAIHYKNMDDLNHRISVIYALINNYNKFEKVDFTLSFSAGVYLLKKGEKTNADVCLNNAIIAQKSVNLTREKYYCIYDEKLDEARQYEREIELRKEQAITNKEFRVHFQPKLNLLNDNIDGAEALVRWYYPEQDKIYSPAKFLPIFEVDGFIEKLDRYVYLEVLSFMKKMVDTGKKVCPISINVSRFTALQPDFLSFYIENKKKYGIADNYICIEFTESFAFDNNQKLFEIVKQLKKNGMMCSIDDFGVGYSSYSILKDLPMDEIKLDAFFLRHGYDKERDEKTLKSVIKLGKDLGMKVTQEGVESNEEMETLKKYGCDVLQGYIYSKPLSQTLFEQFLLEKLGSYGKQKNV